MAFSNTDGEAIYQLRKEMSPTHLHWALKSLLEDVIQRLRSALKKILKGDDSREKELVRKYKGSSLSAVPRNYLKIVMLWTGLSCFCTTSIPIAMWGGEKPNWPRVQAVRVVVMFFAVAFIGSLLGLLMERKLPKLSFYSGYVSLFSLLFALGIIAFLTFLWVFERI